MGMSDLEAWHDRISDFADSAADVAADSMSEAIDESLRSDTGGDGALSRHDGGTATVDTNANGSDAQVTAGGSMAVWGILEHGTQPHTVQARRGSALMTPYGPKSMVQHQGTNPRETWSNGIDDGEPRMLRAVDDEWEQVVGA